jgi:hypothetical protein
MAETQSIVKDLGLLIRTRHAIVTIQTFDEGYVTRQIRQAAGQMGLPVYEWSVSDGLRRTYPSRDDPIKGTDALQAVLRKVRDSDEIGVYIFKDALGLVNEPATERLLREIAQAFVRDNRTLFLVDHAGSVPDCLQGLAMPYDVALPDDEEILSLVKRTFREINRYGDHEVKLSRDQFEKFLSNLRGLSRAEISQVVAGAFLGDGMLGEADLARVLQAKRSRLRQTGVLDYLPAPNGRPSVGGMERLRNWLHKRRRAFTPEARDFGLRPPKGILMLGVQGCGKSLMAKFVAADWRLPLLRMDVGALYDKYVGESERHLRQAFAVASAMAPCVLWIDEIEKAFASAGAGSAGAASDGGLSQRMFGQLLSWMQDHDDPVFIVATANDISALPPELMRKGRFDEIFFVDLPGEDARRSIFEIHLQRRGRKAEDFDVDRLVEASEGFSGSEIEQAIISALYAAFADDRKLDNDDILRELEITQPLSVVMAEKIAELRSWAHGRCVLAD